MTLPSSCFVCEVPESSAKYKCPKCRVPYCSVACWKLHKEAGCGSSQKETDRSNETEVTDYKFATEDTVPVEVLQRLGHDTSLKAMLQQTTLKDLLLALDESKNPNEDLKKAMKEPEFVNFVDKCLSIVDPEFLKDDGMDPE